MKNPTVVVIGDVHHPYAHQPTLERIYDLIDQTRPGLVLQIGDARDLYSWSKFHINPNLTTPEQELDRGTEQFQEMWRRVHKAAPRAKCIQILGNHDDRGNKRLAEVLPACKAIAAPTMRALFEAPGVETHHDSTEELFLNTAAGEVCFQHGHRSKLGDHMRYNQMSTVCGHSHTGGVVYGRVRSKVIWELNAGWTGDELSPVFRYGQQNRLRGWTTGAGVVDHNGPRFISFSRKGLA